MMNTNDLIEIHAPSVLDYLKGRSPRTKREIQQSTSLGNQEAGLLLYEMRVRGLIRVVMEDDGVPRYALAAPEGDAPSQSPLAREGNPPQSPLIRGEGEQAQCTITPLDKGGEGGLSPSSTATTPLDKVGEAGVSPPTPIAPTKPLYTEMMERALLLVADGAPRTLGEIAQGLGLDHPLPVAVVQRLQRRMRRVGSSGRKALYVINPRQPKAPKDPKAPAAPLPVAEVEEVPEIIIQAPATAIAPPDTGCGGACGCHPKPPAPRSNSLLDAMLKDAQELADEALEEYVGLLNDSRLNALIQAARHLRDARAALS